MIGTIGPPGVRKTIQYAPDGIHFKAIAHVPNPPGAPGGYRPDAFSNAKNAKPMSWGISMSNFRGDCYLVRFECDFSGLDVGR